MGAGPHPEAVRSRIRRLKKKYPGSSWELLRASNGEACLRRLDTPGKPFGPWEEAPKACDACDCDDPTAQPGLAAECACAHHKPAARPTLTYDGWGINGPDEHRTRIAKFSTGAAGERWGPLLARAPDLLAALRWIADHGDTTDGHRPACYAMRDAARRAFAGLGAE